MSLLAKIQIKTDGTEGAVTLNGVDISKYVIGYEIAHQVDCVPVVKLAFVADLDFEGDGETAVISQGEVNE